MKFNHFSFVNYSFILFIFGVLFFGHIAIGINYTQYQIVILFFTLLLLLINKVKINIKYNIDWLFLLMYISFSMIYTKNYSLTFQYIFMLYILLLIKIIFESNKFSLIKIVKIFIIFSSIHLLFTIFQYLTPEFIIKLNKLILYPQDYINNLELLNIKNYSGLTGQTGMNSFFISLFLSSMGALLVTNKKKSIIIILIIFGYIGLLLTVKRSHLMISSICLLTVILLSSGNLKSFLKNVLLIISLCITGLIILNLGDFSDGIIDKITSLNSSADMTNGRLQLWGDTLSLFYDSPIFGIGLGSVQNYIPYNTHNIYIQLMTETGIIGVLLFVVVIIKNLLRTIWNYISIKNNITKLQTQIFIISIYLQIQFILYGFFGNPLYSLVMMIPYFVFCGLSNKVIINYSR